jgi:thiol-disulfide isomerase/thioredoxin
MKRFFLLFLFLQTFCVYSQNRGTYTVVCGRIAFPNLKTAPIHELGLADIFKLNGRDHSVGLDSLGYFNMQISMDNPSYFKILDNRIYLRPGDSLYVEVDSNAAISYSGIHHQVLNNYLRNVPYSKTGGFYRYGSIVSMDVDKTVDSMIYLFRKQKDELQAIEKQLSSAVFKTELNRLWCLALGNSSKLGLTVEYMSKYNISQDSAESIVSKASLKLDDLKSEAQRALIIDEDIFELEDFVRHRKSLVPISNELKLFDEFNLAFELNQKILRLKDANDLTIRQKELANMEQNRYRPILQKNMAFVQAKFEKELPNFSFKDLKNELNFLDAYKGKVVYIELWATWCGPCVKLKPDLYRLHDLYKDEQNFVVLSISIDQDKESWKQYVRKHHSPLVEWYANKEFTDYFQVTTIPRSILIGRDGEILEWNAPKPNDIELRKRIDKLIYNYRNGNN